MTEQAPQTSYEHLLASLTEQEQEACSLLAWLDWATGLTVDTLNAMEITPELLEPLIERGLIQRGTTQEFATESLGKIKPQYEAIKQRMRDNLVTFDITDPERHILQEYDRLERVISIEEIEVRYRLASEGFHNWLKKNPFI